MQNQIRTRDVKLVTLGNAKGIRIPKALLQKYGLEGTLLLEETDRGILLRTKEKNKLSWEDTYKAMADDSENWNEFEITIMDGIEDDDVEY